MDTDQIEFGESGMRNVLFVISLFFIFSGISAAQEKPRVFDQVKYKHPNQPIEVIDCHVAGKRFEKCAGITGDADWWRSLTFTAKNTTQKAITDFTIYLWVPIQGKPSVVMNVLVLLQPQSLPDENGKRVPRYLRAVPAGAEALFTVSEYELESWARNFAKNEVAEIQSVALDMRQIYFDDGVAWYFGRESKLKAGQSEDRKRKLVTTDSTFTNAPITVTGLKANGKSFVPNEPFTGDGDWLNDLTVSFRNEAKTDIIAVNFHIKVLDSKPIRPSTLYPVLYGIEPSNRIAADPAKKRSLPPAMIGQVKMDPDWYAGMKRNLAFREDITSRTTAELRLEVIYFADGTMWEMGRYLKPDPEKAGRYIPIKEK